MDKYQEALNKIINMGDKDLYNDHHLEWANTLQELVDKATPKKPEQFGNNGYCPKCHYLVHSFYEYCCWCGQALDWSDEDDK